MLVFPLIAAHVCGDPLSRYTCRATRVAADFPQTPGVFQVCTQRCRATPAPPKKPCRTCRPPTARGVAHQAASEKVSSYRGV